MKKTRRTISSNSSQKTEPKDATSCSETYQTKTWYTLWKQRFQLSWESIRMCKPRENILRASTWSTSNLILRTLGRVSPINCKSQLMMHPMILLHTRNPSQLCLSKVRKLIRTQILFREKSLETDLKIFKTSRQPWATPREFLKTMKHKTLQNKHSEKNCTKCKPSWEKLKLESSPTDSRTKTLRTFRMQRRN